MIFESHRAWSIIDVFDDVEDKLHVFNSLHYDQHAPIRTFKVRDLTQVEPIAYVCS